MSPSFRSLLALVLSAPALALAQISINASTGPNGNPALADAPGWPITIGVPGHFRLTSNLIVNGNTTAIHITVPGVTLDLNGYSILGPVSCSVTNNTLQCVGPTTLSTYGVLSVADHTVVRNGHVRGFGAGGMSIKSGIVESVQVESNDGPGIAVASGPGTQPSRVSGVTVLLNRGYGIFTRQALIERAVLSRNDYGLTGYRYSLVDSLVIDNMTYGVWDTGAAAEDHGAIKGTVVHSNGTASLHGTVRSLGGNLVDGASF